MAGGGQIFQMIFVLFGATGDLSKRMVLPAFYGLFCKGLLPEAWCLVGNGRGQVGLDAFRQEIKDALEASDVEVTTQSGLALRRISILLALASALMNPKNCWE